MGAEVKKICIVATVSVAHRVFMREHVERLSERYHVTLVCSGASDLESAFTSANVNLVDIEIQRNISLFRDLVSLFKLLKLFCDERFDAVHSLMPKSGLLAMLAAKLACVPVRIHIFTGQVWVTSRGFKRRFLKALDWLLASAATHLLADSPSQRQFLLKENVVACNKIFVLGPGSISGVDTGRFRPNPGSAALVRGALGIPPSATVFLFMARLTRDKGAIDIVQAFLKISNVAPNAHLLMVGPDEQGLDEIILPMVSEIRERFHRVGFTAQPEDYMAASDVFCIPSYREGFSLATIQAAGARLPAIASRIYGLIDAVDEGVTGLMHEPGAIDSISNCMLKLYEDAVFRELLAENARCRAVKDFDQRYIVGLMSKFYCDILEN